MRVIFSLIGTVQRARGKNEFLSTFMFSKNLPWENSIKTRMKRSLLVEVYLKFTF